jgi:hypothetical protein
MSIEDNTMQASDEATVEETTADSQTVEQTDDSNDSNVSQEAIESNESGSNAEVREDNKPASQDQDAKTDSKPLSRRSAAYRIKQLVEENKTLREQQKPAAQDEWELPLEDDEKPDIEALIAKEVEKRLNPVISESTKNADDGEISELFSGDKAADRSKYEGKIREMWNLPQYKDVAAADLYKIAKFDELSSSMDSIKQQAVEEYKKAEREAKDSSAGGNSNISNRTGKTGKSISEMTDQELLEHNERVKAGLA